MRIKANTTLTEQDVRDAAKYAREQGQDFWIDEILVGKRGAISVYCVSHNGRYACNGREGRAASWAAWGHFISDLFARDPKAIIGPYKGVEDFGQCVGASFIHQCQDEHERTFKHRPADLPNRDISILDHAV